MITAKCVSATNPITCRHYEGLEVGKEYEVRNISMGPSFTFVLLKDIIAAVNSVCLKFYEDGKPLDIYKDARFNPYL